MSDLFVLLWVTFGLAQLGLFGWLWMREDLFRDDDD